MPGARAQTATPQPAPVSDNPQLPATFHAVSRLVIVDVTVTDRSGNPVPGLKRSQFRVFDNDREQTISSFEEFAPGRQPAAAAALALPPDTYTNYDERPSDTAVTVLLLDVLNTPFEDQIYAKTQMLKYLREIPPGTRLAVFGLASQLRILQGFTGEDSVLASTLKEAQALSYSSPLLPQKVFEETTARQNPMAQEMLANMRQFEADEATFQTDLRVRMTLDAFRAIAAYLSGLSGRKNLLWFSGSFPLNIAPDTDLPNALTNMRSYSSEVRAVSDELSRARVAIYPVDARGLMPPLEFSPANPGTGNGSARAFAGATRNFNQGIGVEHATMEQLAHDTGGHAFYNTNDLKGALARATRDGASYYSLAYVPSNHRWDGKLRKLRVEVAGGNYRLEYRRGYFADAAEGGRHAEDAESSKQLAMQRGAPNSTQMVFEAHVWRLKQQPAPGTPRAGNLSHKVKGELRRYGINYALFASDVSLSASGPRDARRGGLTFNTVAYDANNEILSTNSQDVQINVAPKNLGRFRDSGLFNRQEIDLPVGQVFLRLAIQDKVSGRIGSLEVPLSVTPEPEGEKPVVHPGASHAPAAQNPKSAQ